MVALASPGSRTNSLCQDDFILCLHETFEEGWLAGQSGSPKQTTGHTAINSKYKYIFSRT
jgi:hypothetical protein